MWDAETDSGRQLLDNKAHKDRRGTSAASSKLPVVKTDLTKNYKRNTYIEKVVEPIDIMTCRE